jgi:RNA polymerase sigma-70 factor, ECF subfamily
LTRDPLKNVSANNRNGVVLSALSGENRSNGGRQWDWAAARLRCLREARLVLRDRDDADEAVQEALARAWGRQETCRTPEAPLPWLLQITRNEAIRLLQRRSERHEREGTALAEADQADPARDQEFAITRLDVQRAVGALDNDERLLIGLRYINDLTQQDVARTLNQPEGTVKVRLHRIRERLRVALEEPH